MKLSGFPLANIEAELYAFPFATEQSFVNGLVRFQVQRDRIKGLQFSSATGTFWRITEKEILNRFPGLSIDNLNRIRDACWFPKQHSIELLEFLSSVATRYFQISGLEIFPKREIGILSDLELSRDHSLELSAARWLMLTMPSDLLVASAFAKHSTLHDISKVQVDWLTPLVKQLLIDKGFAETHLHLGSAMDFPTFWSRTIAGLSMRQVGGRAFASPNAPFNNGRDLGGWVLRAAICRLVLASFLALRRPNEFSRYIVELIQRLSGNRNAANAQLVALTLNELRRGKFDTLGMHRSAYLSVRASYRQMVNELQSSFHKDPLSKLIRADEEAQVEQQFMFQALNYVRRHPDDELFAKLTLQYLRVRNIYYRFIVQQPFTPGLQNFVRHFARLSRGNRYIHVKQLVEKGAQLSGLNRGLRAFEFRTKLGNAPLMLRLRKATEELESRQKKRQPDFETGMVLHLTKDRGGGSRKGVELPRSLGSHADPSSSRFGIRYGKLIHSMLSNAVGSELIRHVSMHPRFFGVLCGLDVCSDELGLPNWLIGASFRKLRTRLLGFLGRSTRKKDRLGTTIHVGEDFSHLLTGLRNVEESIRMYGLERGDRLGHGLALGIDCRTWCQKVEFVPMTVETRLFDLIWLYRFLAYERMSDVVDGFAFSQKLTNLANKMFPNLERRIDIDRLVQFQKQLANAANIEAVYRVLCGRQLRFRASNLDKFFESLLYRYFTCPRVFAYSQKAIMVDVASEFEMLKAVQGRLLERIRRIGITIEINPSSNLVVRDLRDLKDHPFWRLRPPLESKEHQLPVCIGSDDPLTFATSLPLEYQIVHDSIAKQFGANAAIDWIDGVRSWGLRSRFTRDRSH